MNEKPKFINHGLIQLFYNLISLFDKGFKENIDTIEKHMYDKDLLPYLINKYEKEEDFSYFKGGPCSTKDLNYYICEMVSYVNGNESRKYGITNEENGLLLLIAVCFDNFQYTISKVKEEYI